MCCLGFAAGACGVSARGMTGRPCPSDLGPVTKRKVRAQLPWLFSEDGAVFGIVLSVAGHGCVSCASKYRIVPAATAPGKEP